MPVTKKGVDDAMESCREMRASLGAHEGEVQSHIIGSLVRIVAMSATALASGPSMRGENLDYYGHLVGQEAAHILALLAAFDKTPLPETIDPDRMTAYQRFYDQAISKILLSVGFK